MEVGSQGILHMVSCFTPTRAVRREVKDAFFFQELDHMLASVSPGENYVVLGYFNAHVGYREHVGDWWMKEMTI